MSSGYPDKIPGRPNWHIYLVDTDMQLVSEVSVQLGEEGVAMGGVSEPSLIPVPLPDHTHYCML